MDLSRVSWRKSSWSNANGGQCVEVGVWHRSSARRLFLVRDSRKPYGPVVAVSSSEWGLFVEGVKGRGLGDPG
ncbi:DUF397 domain-containing protein [Sphaerisporangium aureirubrum]|uniref:DUF397 domain-containing protein n=1 Tax=Sphaerisporangium aureirubrum TaxID=1544736 RepID=A0ABW1NBC5_9ACTN